MWMRFERALREAVAWTHQARVQKLILTGLAAVAVIVFAKSVTHNRDFGGYLLVGNLVLDGRHIYAEAPPGINTWPPFFSLLCAPLAAIDRHSFYLSRTLWLLFNFGIVLWILRIIARQVFDRPMVYGATTLHLSPASAEMLIPLLLTARYLLSNFDHLQVNLLIFALALSGLDADTRRRPFLGAFMLGLGAALKVMPIAFLPYLAYRRRWRAAIGGVAVWLALSMSPVLVFGGDRLWDYARAWRAAVATGWSVGKMNQSVHAMVDRFLGHGLTPFSLEARNSVAESGSPIVFAAVFTSFLIVAGAAWLVFRRSSGEGRIERLAEWSAVFIVATIFAPVAWKAYFVVLLLPNALLFSVILADDQPPVLRKRLAAALVGALVIGNLASQGLIGKELAWVIEMSSGVTWAALILFAAVLLLHLRHSRPA